MEFIDFSGAGYQESAPDDAAPEPSAPPYNPMTSSHLADPSKPPFFNHGLPPGMSCDIKPRLTKEQHDILEDEFRKQNKPNTNTKKGFAEQLGVSLDKVNNWFQNRRAKSKQDAKKQAGALHLYPTSQDPQSDGQNSPCAPSAEYYSMLQQFNAEQQQQQQQQLSHGVSISQSQQVHDQDPFQSMPFSTHVGSSEQVQNYGFPQQYPDMFSNDPEMNRRTLTQETFDAMEQNDNILNTFAGDQDIMNQVFPNWQGFTKQDAYSFPHPVGAPLSSIDSTIPSSVSDQSMPAFPSSTNMQHQPSISATSSEWAESRSSSVQDLAFGPTQSQTSATSSQWRPGQSIPVDFNAQIEEFRRAAQGRSSTQQLQTFEQPLAWPEDEAYLRRESSASLLAQSMSHVGIETPYPQQQATFKSPAPPSSIATRRQRPRPAALGIASLRSQSYSGVVPPESPRQLVQHQQQQQLNFNPTQNLRRIRSSNVVGGAVATGRVMKSMPGSAQRSPLSYSFADAMNSPHAIRHPSQSQGNLAPPTPMSPSEFKMPEQTMQAPSWHTGPIQTTRHASISENDTDQFMQYRPSASVPAQNWSSPPHTPMFYQQQQFVQQRVGNNVITENTPPQSAPASQTCFQVNGFPQPQHTHQHHMPSAAQQQHMFASKPPQQPFVGQAVPDQQFQMSNVTFLPNQQANLPTSGPPPGIPLQFANGVPAMNAEGTMHMTFPPPQVQVVQHSQPDMHASPQAGHSYGTSSNGSPNLQSSKHTPQPASDFFVHEYTPPDAIKRTSTPRKAVDSGPKNFVFSNTGPVDFTEKKAKESITSGSPSSTNGSIASST